MVVIKVGGQQFWSNFVDSMPSWNAIISTDRFRIERDQALKEAGAVLQNSRLIFEKDSDATLFILRWS